MGTTRSRARQRVAATAQRLAGRRLVGPALARAMPARFGSRAARSTTISAVARPVHFPQLGRGSIGATALPEPDSARFTAFVASARRRFDVAITDHALAAPHAREALVALCAAGAPVRVVGAAEQLDALVGRTLAAALSQPAPADQRERELRSITLRRAALALDMPAAPGVSVLLATRRPADVVDAIEQVGRQTGCRLQLVVGLHGDGWPREAEAGLANAVRASAVNGLVVARYPSEVSLGAMLAAMTELSTHPLVTKWDDDDWYGSQHVVDLALAHAYSGADIIGKAAEFVYLESADTTVRRMAIGAESYSTTIAGGTLLTSRSWLDEIGGWPDVRTAVDRALLAGSARRGGTSYRTHGFQYVLRRRADGGHTWASGDDYFLDAASDRRTGLELGFAGID